MNRQPTTAFLKALRYEDAALDARWNDATHTWEILRWAADRQRPGQQLAHVVMLWPHPELNIEPIRAALAESDVWKRGGFVNYWRDVLQPKLLKQQQERSKQYAAAAATGRQELANALRRDLGLRTTVSFASTSPGGIIIP